MTNFWKTLNKPITILAPMDDVTDFVFREIVANTAKPDVLFTEFVCTDALFTKGHEATIKRLKYSERQKPIVAQIWGTNPEKFAQAANYIQELGFDGIDINMGCPVRNVQKRGAGAALINNKTVVSELISAVKKGAPNIPLSIKTRIGNTTELTIEWLTFLIAQNIQALTIHGRKAKAMSKYDANWEEIGKAVQIRNNINADTLIIGNGDVKTYQEVLEKQTKYGVDGVMIGRGIFQNPWVFEKNVQTELHTTQEYLDLLLTHTKLFNDTWGRTKNFEIMKKFFKVYVNSFKGADDLRQRLMECKDYNEVAEIINEKNISKLKVQ